MPRNIETPTVTPDGSNIGGEYFNHPAFGCLEVTRINSSGGIELFNSALKHSHWLCIKISKASLHRNHHHDRVTSRLDDRMVEFYLSEAQWASFVSSQGVGTPTPCTFNYYPEYNKLVNVPGIESEEKMKETFSREIREKAARDIKEAKAITADLAELIEAGTLGKTQLREIQKRLDIFSGNFASNMGFTQDMFAEAMEKTIEAGKAEIEGFVVGQAQRLGLEQMRSEIPVLKLDNKP